MLGMIMPAAAQSSTPFHVSFRPGSIAIDPYGAAVLDNAGAAYRQVDVRLFTVVGRTDRTGSADLNLRLSRRRAEAVRTALVARGVPAERIRVEAVGEGNPLVGTADGVAEPLNRSAEVIISEMCRPPPMYSKSANC
jgi:outer membrane protein OmpA-like peptidoglycan-associated protein